MSDTPPEDRSVPPHSGRTSGPEFARALLEAQKKATSVPATEKHYDNYRFAGIRTIKEHLRPVLNEQGLTLELVNTEFRDQLELETSGGGLQWMTDIYCTYRVTHAETGQYREFRVLGRRTNDKDKGVRHAISSATAAFWLELLQVHTEQDDTGQDPSPSQRRRGRQPKRRRSGPPSGAPGSQGHRKEGDDWIDNATGEIVESCDKCRRPKIHCTCEDESEPEASSQEDPRADEAREAADAGAKARRVLSETKASYRSFLGKRTEDWQEEALVRANKETPSDLARWKLEHYQAVIALFKKHGAPVVLSRAAEEMARREPAATDSIEALRANVEGMGAQLEQRAEVAIQSGWQYAVDELLNIVAVQATLEDEGE